MSISPNGLKAYVANIAGGNISIVDLDPSSGSYQNVTGYISGTFQYPISVAFTADGSQAYVANQVSSTGFVSVVNTALDQVASTLSGYDNPTRLLAVGDFPTAFAQTVSCAVGLNSITITGYDAGNSALTFNVPGTTSNGKTLTLTGSTATSATYSYTPTATAT